MSAISHTSLSNSFCCTNIILLRLRFHWITSQAQLTMSQHCFGQCVVVEYWTGRFLNWIWYSLLTRTSATRPSLMRLMAPCLFGCSHYMNKTASFQKEAMHTQVALQFLWINKASKPDKLRKFYCFKILWSERNAWIWLHLFIPKHVLHDISSVLHADRALHGAWFILFTVTWKATWLRGVGCPVLAAR